jgi:NAD(P)-dependent dehydrogenase (short-subunit alcohol dehydrogenase family)
MTDLTRKRVVVTGGGTGIGRAIALAFARAGARVAICGRREGPLAETVALQRGEPAIRYRACDVSDRAQVAAFFAWVRAELGGVDVLVNSAGTNVPRRSLAETSPEDWDRLIAVNASGAFYATYEVLPEMRARRDGLIVHINSTSGKRAHPLGGVAYNASKHAMSALGLTTGYEERENGIRVTNVYPGEVDTPILEKRPSPVSAEHRAKILQPEDVAEVVLAIARLPPRANVAEVVIKPTVQAYA